MNLTKIPVWQMMLAHIYKNDPILTLTVSTNLKITASHAYHIKNEFIAKGYITTIHTGRDSPITLTPKGRVIAAHCLQIVRRCYKPIQESKQGGKDEI